MMPQCLERCAHVVQTIIKITLNEVVLVILACADYILFLSKCFINFVKIDSKT